MHRNQTGSSFFGTLILLALLCGVIWVAGTTHFVMTRAGMRTYPKTAFTLSETYVDMGSTSVLGLRRYPRTVSAMIQAGDTKLLPGGQTLEAVARMGRSVMDAIDRFDNEGEIAENVLGMASEAGRLVHNSAEKYRQLDSRYDLTGKTRTAVEGATNLAEKGLAGLNQILERRH